MVFLFNKKMMLDDEGNGSGVNDNAFTALEDIIYEAADIEAFSLENIEVGSTANTLTLNVLNAMNDAGVLVASGSGDIRISDKENKVYSLSQPGKNKYYPGAYVLQTIEIPDPEPDPESPQV